MTVPAYSSKAESARILDIVTSLVNDAALPAAAVAQKSNINFTSTRDAPYFPIPLKETEVTAALKAIEGSLAAALAATKDQEPKARRIRVDLEKTTAFLFQAYLARIGGLGKLDKDVRSLLKDTDLLQAQSDPYRRMSANLYRTADADEYYHIHGSLEASTTLQMIGLPSHQPNLKTHADIVAAIEPAVERHTVAELEALNAKHRQAGVKAFKHEEFLQTPHGRANVKVAPWSVDAIETTTPPSPLPTSSDNRPLSGIKVLEICRIIAGPTICRILGEYGADVLKITSPHLSDVPFFQVDGNMGKHAAELDLKTPEGREKFEALLAEADVLVDGYRPGALEKLGYGPKALGERAAARGRGYVYVNENCFGYEGEWNHRPGWQQIADCVSGVAWAQGKFMGLDEPVVPPFPISDYGTGCMGAIAAMSGLYHRATKGGSWHGKASLLQYDLLLFRVGLLPEEVQQRLRDEAGEDFFALRHAHSVDHISGVALRQMRKNFPGFVDHPRYLDHWYSEGYGREVAAVKPVVEIEGLEISFRRASRPNGADEATWVFEDKDRRVEVNGSNGRNGHH
ncbi:CoA-transferase family III domain-containing protein [Plectosphaerella cucumerina]|uniref:CoA-transferase family III domain-containing protein n=1 Tax=Plectosphaerella cucumerina TaxID=40658 RepID=A0A8K0T9C1_9PEZI|nr:CoA-transferase family III domain-containing protein [Plectosphaerella cucumerina]